MHYLKIHGRPLLLVSLLICGLIFAPILFSRVQAFETETKTEEDDDIDTDPEEIGENKKKEAEREIDIEVDDDSATIKSVIKNSQDKDDFTIDISLINELRIHTLYKSRAADTKVNLEFQVRLYSLFEFVDNDGDGGYNEDSDSILQELELESFNPIVYRNESAHILEIESTDGIFLVRIYAVEGFTDINGSIIDPAEIKVDFEIHDFPFTESNSLLGLQIYFQTNAQYHFEEKSHGEEDEFRQNETEIALEDQDFTGFFAWNNEANIDGVLQAVNSTNILPNGNDKKLILIYPHGMDIVHDPIFGLTLDYGISIPGYAWILIFGSIATTTLFLVKTIYRKRK